MHQTTSIGMIFAGVFGLIWGSFLNVLIHRLPLDQSIVRPRSHCPGCKRTIPWYYNIPVLSWIVLRGRCAWCREPISPRYPLVELIAGLATVMVYVRLGVSLEAAIYWPFVLAMIVLAFVDLEHQILPNEITLGGLVVGLALSFVNPMLGSDWVTRFRDAAIGAAVGAGLLWGLSKLWLKLRGFEGMGLGDVKMMGFIGAYGGWQALFPTLMLASLGGLGAALVLMALRKGSLQSRIPFGTFLAPASVAVVLFGQELFHWYQTTILGGGIIVP